jgi:hypothetical protein
MKYRFIFILSVVACASCNNQEKPSKTEEPKSIVATEESVREFVNPYPM